MRHLLAFAFVAACGGGGGNKPVVKQPEPTPDPIAKTAGPECNAVARQLVPMMLAEHPESHTKAIEVTTVRCTEDKWNDEARNCLATAQSMDESEGCVKHLSKSQQEAFKAAAEEVAASKKETEAAVAPPPPPKAGAPADGKPRTRGPVKKPKKPAGGDPCQGGEVSGDPCQGGQ